MTTMSTTGGTTIPQLLGGFGKHVRTHKYDIAYSGVDWRHRLSEVAR
jgi:hypothetical protein